MYKTIWNQFFFGEKATLKWIEDVNYIQRKSQFFQLPKKPWINCLPLSVCFLFSQRFAQKGSNLTEKLQLHQLYRIIKWVVKKRFPLSICIGKPITRMNDCFFLWIKDLSLILFISLYIQTQHRRKIKKLTLPALLLCGCYLYRCVIIQFSLWLLKELYLRLFTHAKFPDIGHI